MNELRLIGRAATALSVLALLAGALALYALHADAGSDPGASGATVRGVIPVVTSLRAGGPAERAGLHVGDVVERIDGRRPQSLADVERSMASGRHAAFAVSRAGRTIDVVVN